MLIDEQLAFQSLSSLFDVKTSTASPHAPGLQYHLLVKDPEFFFNTYLNSYIISFSIFQTKQSNIIHLVVQYFSPHQSLLGHANLHHYFQCHIISYSMDVPLFNLFPVEGLGDCFFMLISDIVDNFVHTELHPWANILQARLLEVDLLNKENTHLIRSTICSFLNIC